MASDFLSFFDPYAIKNIKNSLRFSIQADDILDMHMNDYQGVLRVASEGNKFVQCLFVCLFVSITITAFIFVISQGL